MDAVKHFRDRFNIPINDNDIESLPYYKPAEDSPEMVYLRERRAALHGYLPQRRVKFSESLDIPKLKAFQQVLDGSNGREISTTMALSRVLTALLKDKSVGKRIVPIIPDEARTFGMEGLFRQVGIYAHGGQKYTPQDADQVAYYREDKTGAVLQEGINEGGAMSSWMAAATSYSVNDAPTIPFYIYYSMFGFQRIGDQAWAAGDLRARGFMIGGTSGRTTLNGEGLQHEDGHSHLQSATIPNCISYDPAYGYEIAVIVQEGMDRMYGERQEDVFYYITTLNENYVQPAMPEGVEEGIIKGIYKLDHAKKKAQVQLLGCGSILRHVREAAEILASDYSIDADVFSVTSFTELARDGNDVERHNMLHPGAEAKEAYITKVLAKDVPVVATTDYMRIFADQVRAYVPAPYKVLGTDGFGRSDSRENLRNHFEVSAPYVVVAALSELVKNGDLDAKVVPEAIEKFGLDVDKVYSLYA